MWRHFFYLPVYSTSPKLMSVFLSSPRAVLAECLSTLQSVKLKCYEVTSFLQLQLCSSPAVGFTRTVRQKGTFCSKCANALA